MKFVTRVLTTFAIAGTALLLAGCTSTVSLTAAEVQEHAQALLSTTAPNSVIECDEGIELKVGESVECIASSSEDPEKSPYPATVTVVKADSVAPGFTVEVGDSPMAEK